MATVFIMSPLLEKTCLTLTISKILREKICLSDSIKKAIEFSLSIFGLLKATKLLEGCRWRCEVCLYWTNEKAHKYQAKAKRSEKKTELTNQSPKNTK